MAPSWFPITPSLLGWHLTTVAGELLHGFPHTRTTVFPRLGFLSVGRSSINCGFFHGFSILRLWYFRESHDYAMSLCRLVFSMLSFSFRFRAQFFIDVFMIHAFIVFSWCIQYIYAIYLLMMYWCIHDAFITYSLWSLFYVLICAVLIMSSTIVYFPNGAADHIAIFWHNWWTFALRTWCLVAE